MHPPLTFQPIFCFNYRRFHRYFMFLGFFSKWLTYPALTGTFFFVWQRVNGSDSNILFIFCIFLCAWAWLM